MDLKHPRRSAALSDVARYPLALLPSEYSMRRQQDNAFSSQGLTPNVRVEPDALEDLVHAARTSGMLALLNGAAALGLDVGDSIPLSNKALYRQTCLIRSQHRHHSFAARHIGMRFQAGCLACRQHGRDKLSAAKTDGSSSDQGTSIDIDNSTGHEGIVNHKEITS